LKTQISQYNNGNGSLPVIPPSLAGSLLQYASVNPKTNPTLYQYVQYMQSELYSY